MVLRLCKPLKKDGYSGWKFMLNEICGNRERCRNARLIKGNGRLYRFAWLDLFPYFLFLALSSLFLILATGEYRVF